MVNVSLADQIHKHGYLVIKNVFSHEEILQLRKLINNHFSTRSTAGNCGLTQPNAAVAIPQINWLFYHSKVLTLMDELFGQEQIMFTSHCDVHSNTLSGWHKDDGTKVVEGGYFGIPTYDESDCRVYKMAIYLQDHVHNQAGLTVKKGSHRFSSLDRGEETCLSTQMGDLIIFDVRLTHTGQRNALPFFHLQQPVNLTKKIAKKIGKIEPQKIDRLIQKFYSQMLGARLSIFFTYGVANEYTKKFAISNMKRQISQTKNNSNIFLTSNTKQKLLDNNIQLAEDYFEQLVC